MYFGQDLPNVALARREIGFSLLVAGLSMVVGLFSLLPFLPSDGGGLLLLAVETYSGQMIPARLKRGLQLASAVFLFLATVASIYFWRRHQTVSS